MKSPAAQWFVELSVRTKLIEFIEIKAGRIVVRASHVTVHATDEYLSGGCNYSLVKVSSVAYSVFSGKAFSLVGISEGAVTGAAVSALSAGVVPQALKARRKERTRTAPQTLCFSDFFIDCFSPFR